MNNLILIRGGKIAFSMRAGYDDTNNDNVCNDLKDTMFTEGWFIPSSLSGMQAAYFGDMDQIYRPQDITRDHGCIVGIKGVLCNMCNSEVGFHQVEIHRNKQMILTPLYTGDSGFAIISSFTHYADMMAMCVQLTKTIEESVDMFFRHVPGDRTSVLIWDKHQVAQHLIEFHQKNLERKIKAISEMSATS